MKPYEQIYQIRGQEIDYTYRLKPYYMAAFFQNNFACDFTDRGLAAFDLQRDNKSWAISEIHIEFWAELPFWRSDIRLVGWNSKVQGLKLYRDFEAFSADGQLLARGTSSWFVFDQTKRRPVRMDFLLDKIEVINKQAIPDFVFSKIKPFEGLLFEESQKVRSYDLDFNWHVNSMRYIAGALETVPLEYRKVHRIKSYTIKYARETMYGELIRSKAFQNDNQFFHHLTKNSDQTEICRMFSEWEAAK